MFPGNGVQQGLRYVFSCLVGVSKMSAQSAATCIQVHLNELECREKVHFFLVSYFKK